MKYTKAVMKKMSKTTRGWWYYYPIY